MKRTGIGIGLALLAMACVDAVITPTNGSVHVSIIGNATSYEPGESLAIKLSNTSTAELGYNICSANVQKKNGDEWVTLGSLRLCDASLYLLHGESEKNESYALEEGLADGTYRLEVTLHQVDPAGEEPILAHSGEFLVSGGNE